MDTSDYFLPRSLDEAQISDCDLSHQGELSDSSPPRAQFLRTRPKKRASVPYGTSTPKTAADAYDFTDDSQHMEYDQGPRASKNRASSSVSEPTLAQVVTRLLSRIETLECTFMSAIQKLSEEGKRRDKQIENLSRKVDQLTAPHVTPNPPTSTSSKQANYNEKAAVRWALKEAEIQRGVKLNADHPVQSEQNKRAVEFAWRAVKTSVPEMKRPTFMVAAKRRITTMKEEESRKKHNTDAKHKDANRKKSRKFAKSRSRVTAIKHCADFTPEEREKLMAALADVKMQSSEESDVDEEGQRVFIVHNRPWEAATLTEAKKKADAITKRSRKNTAIPRVPGTPSNAPPPEDLGDLSWVATDYGMV